LTLGGAYELVYRHNEIIGGQKNHDVHHGSVLLRFSGGTLGGNLTIYGGKEMFNSYAEHLHALGILVTFAEWGLLIWP
jgi:hypothetical protein